MLHISLFLAVLQFVKGDYHWGYQSNGDELGPDQWHQLYQICNGARQSPINIDKSFVEFDQTLKPLHFQGYDVPILRANVTNDGHTVKVDIPNNVVMRITAPCLSTTYRLKQFHFHWGHKDSEGSEHAIFGKKFPLEMHMVHADEKVNYDTALTESYGLLVVSVLFQFGTNNNELSKLSSYFNRISDPKIRNFTSAYGLIVQNLIPGNILNQNYLTYDGSLTTPPCNEAVKWIILTHTSNVTHQQMTEFRTLKHLLEDGREDQIETNDRTLQGIAGRKVSLYHNFDDLYFIDNHKIG